MKINLKFRTKIFVFSFIILSFFYSYTFVFAATHIKNIDLENGGTWTKENSPYILDENIYITNGSTLNINAGVSVYSASSTSIYSPIKTLYVYNSNLNINGTEAEPVNIYNLDDIYINYTNLNIKNAVFNNTGISYRHSTSTIFQTTIQNSILGIMAMDSMITIDKSKIIDNLKGILSLAHQNDIFLASLKPTVNANTSKNKTNISDFNQNIITINNSIIKGNKNYGISNESINSVSALNNWWGTSKGPTTDTVTGGDKIIGLVDYEPWSDTDLSIVCCSNVIFLPGIEASRLYEDSTGIIGKSTNQLWEPNRNADVKKLFLNDSGKSINSSIYTKDVLDSAFGLKDIYKNLIVMLNDVVADNTINKWLPFPYDWRMNVEDIARGKTTLASSSVSLIDSIEKLSKNSKTGKVIILAHSNGGLLAKSLMRVLEEKKEANIVEKIINVAVPELGAPKAVLSMLHGYDQSILAGVAMTRDNARVFSQNMTSAYSLLPSKKFFENNTIKIINDYFSNSAGKIASTYEGMKNFLLNNSFSKKSSSILNTPLLLNSALMNTANSLHSIFDIWKPASSTKTISLFGWGVLTPSAITYDKNLHCKPVIYAPCQPEITSLLSSDGDGTVLTNSNSNLSDKSFFLNLKTLKTDTEKEIKHADILESVDALNMIKKEIKNPVSDNEYGKYITSSKPVDNDKWLTIRILSPVDIDVYDKKGNHTGIKENYVPTPGIDPIENRIPNSYYEDFADSKRVILLYGEDYQIVLKGNDSGAVIVKASVSQYDNVLASTTFKEMPVTPLLNVELVIPTTLSSLATSSVMNMDIDGDGVTDFVNRSNEFLGATSSYPIVDFATYLESIKKVILSLKLSSREEKRWLEKIEKMAIKFNKSHPRKIERIVKNLSKKRFKNSPLTEVQKTNILKTFDTMLFELEAEK